MPRWHNFLRNRLTWLPPWSAKAFVENFLAKVPRQGKQAVAVLEALRELGFAKLARPLLLAFEAAMDYRSYMLAELEPEVQRATRLMFDWLKA